MVGLSVVDDTLLPGTAAIHLARARARARVRARVRIREDIGRCRGGVMWRSWGDTGEIMGHLERELALEPHDRDVRHQSLGRDRGRVRVRD